MRKCLLWALPIFILSLFFPSYKIFASTQALEIATDSNFSSITTEFSAGQTIYVRIGADNDGSDKHLLNLRDNQYNFLTSYNLNKDNDNQFSTSLAAPQNEGYYSLEAQIESAGSKTTAVKTIKVGSPTNANVKVNVKSEVSGQSVKIDHKSSQSPTISTPKVSPPTTGKEVNEESGFFDNPDIDFGQERAVTQTESSQSFTGQLGQFFKKILSSIWPF